jgi:hypothetical protein
MKKTKWKIGSQEFNEHRIAVVKKRHGANAFKNYGALGGNKMLKDSALVKAYKEGRVRIIK